jgi:hypothetical protein
VRTVRSISGAYLLTVCVEVRREVTVEEAVFGFTYILGPPGTRGLQSQLQSGLNRCRIWFGNTDRRFCERSIERRSLGSRKRMDRRGDRRARLLSLVSRQKADGDTR